MTRSPQDEHVRVLRRLERQLLQPRVRRSAGILNDVLADGFVEFGSSGRVLTKAQIIAALRAEPPVRRSLRAFRAVRLAPGVVLATYRVVRGGAGKARLQSLRSSIWKWTDGQWRMVFHQGTVVKAR